MNLLILATLLFAAAPEAVTVWSAKHVAGRLAAAKPDEHKLTQDSLLHGPGYSMSVIKRQASGIGELHQTVTDILMIQSGECTVITGGKLTNPKNQSATEVRGSAVEGGEKHHLEAGDIIKIAAKTPHQVILDSGKQVVYAAVKLEAR